MLIGICVSRVGEHNIISRSGICVFRVGEHIQLRIWMSFLVKGTNYI